MWPKSCEIRHARKMYVYFLRSRKKVCVCRCVSQTGVTEELIHAVLTMTLHINVLHKQTKKG